METFKSTLFIAVQCCQCSTMQVKQQKKSSNKWTCVVCNQKQSVKKVYAQGCQANQVRQYVQSFNMSRKFADDQVSSLGHFVEHLEGECIEEGNHVEKRTDWSEYIDDEENKEDPVYLKSISKGKEEFEPEIMTEFPNERMFKKPKFKGSSDCSPSTYKPQFRKRNTSDKSCSQRGSFLEARKEISNSHGVYATVEPVGAESAANNNNLLRNVPRGSQQEQGQKSHFTTAKTGASKWSEYMAEDEGDHFKGGIQIAAFADDYIVETDVSDERVEEDVHPDFL